MKEGTLYDRFLYPINLEPSDIESTILVDYVKFEVHQSGDIQ